jgi:peptidoglycan hydrolase CwlO-like protein
VRRALRALVLAVLVVGIIGLGQAWPSQAEDAASTGVELPANAPAVATELDDLHGRLVVVQQQAAAVGARLTEAAIALSATEQQLVAVTAQVENLRAQLRNQAASAYVHHQAAGLDQFSVEGKVEYASGSKYLQVVSSLDGDSLADLLRTQQQIKDARVQRAASRDDLAAKASAIGDERVDLGQRIAADEAELAKWGAVTVMGDAQLSAPQLAAWFRSTGAQPVLAAGTTIDDITRMYLEEGASEHVRGDLAFAQAIIETGGFRVAAGNNYSGIGVCDACTGGNEFATPRDGIRAQIQLLRNYADPASRSAKLRYPPAPGLYGHDPEKAARLYDTFFLKGKAPLWNQMGHGNWATDPTYAPKVIATYVQMVTFANAEPG